MGYTRGSGPGLAGRLGAPGCGKGCPHIQTVLAGAGVCTHEARGRARGPRTGVSTYKADDLARAPGLPNRVRKSGVGYVGWAKSRGEPL